MPTAFTTSDDVQQALQESDASFGTGELATANVEAAIFGASSWFGRQTNGHWYDSNATGLLSTTEASASNVRLSVPSSPHRQRGQLFRDSYHTVYPVTHHGPYARISLPHPYVTSITTLEVRDTDGGVTDWVADAGILEGRGEDYYIERVGQNSYGRTNLYIRAKTIGPRTSLKGVLSVDYNHGLDYQTEAWDDVRRGVAALAAAQLIDDDNVLAGLPEGGSALGVDTQAQQLVNQALGLDGDMGGYLSPYLSAPVE